MLNMFVVCPTKGKYTVIKATRNRHAAEERCLEFALPCVYGAVDAE